MDFHPSKGYSWKTSVDTSNKNTSLATADKSPSTAKSSTTNTAKSVLHTQETHVFRHWMDRVIESSSIKVTQARQAIDTPELVSKSTGANGSSSSSNNIESPSSQLRGTSQRLQNDEFIYTNLYILDDLNAKRQRKRVDEGSQISRKKKTIK